MFMIWDGKTREEKVGIHRAAAPGLGSRIFPLLVTVRTERHDLTGRGERNPRSPFSLLSTAIRDEESACADKKRCPFPRRPSTAPRRSTCSLIPMTQARSLPVISGEVAAAPP